jgi:hypothetical protein
MKIKLIKWRKAVLVVLLAAVAMTMYLGFSNPVFLRIKDPTTVDPKPLLVIFNPFRNRDAEHRAEAFLGEMKLGRCKFAMATLVDDEKHRQYICDKEVEHALLSWRLSDRHDEGRKIKIYYTVLRGGYSGFDGHTWLTVEKVGQSWQVIDYECWY